MARKLFETIPNSLGAFATVSKNESGEFVARMFQRDGRGFPRHVASADGFESDLDGACGTALAMIFPTFRCTPASIAAEHAADLAACGIA